MAESVEPVRWLLLCFLQETMRELEGGSTYSGFVTVLFSIWWLYVVPLAGLNLLQVRTAPDPPQSCLTNLTIA